MAKKKLPEIEDTVTIGDLLAGFDRHLLWLMERRYLDLDDFRVSPELIARRGDVSRLEDLFYGFRIRGLHAYLERDRDLAAQNIENWLGLFRDGSHSFVMTVEGRASETPELAFLVRRVPRDRQNNGGSLSSSEDYARFIERGIAANFPGAERVEFSRQGMIDFAEDSRQRAYVGLLTGIPGRKQTEDRFFSQGLERFLDATAGLTFSVMLVAEPFSVAEISHFIDPVLNVKNAAGQFLKIMVTDSESIANTLNINIFGTGGITSSSSQTYMGEAQMAGLITGLVALAIPGLGPLLATAGAALGTLVGSLAGLPLSRAVSKGLSKMGGVSLGYARTRTRGKSISRESINYAVEYALKLLDEHIERLRTARRYGFWNVGFYIFAPDAQTYAAVTDAAIANFSGQTTHLEPLRIIDLKSPGQDNPDALLDITAGCNPRFRLFEGLKELEGVGGHPLGEHMAELTTPMTTSELAILCAPPQRESRAISVTERAVFGGRTLAAAEPKGQRVVLGEMLYYGERTGEEVAVSLDSLARHVLVTGITGSGKTNTTHGICRQLDEAGVPWLVLEPSAKAEYRDLADVGGVPPYVFTLGAESPAGGAVPFRMNPFWFPKGIEVVAHIDRLKAAFCAAFPMYASMPYLLEEALVRVYEDAGWDLASSRNRKTSSDPWTAENGHLLFPVLSDLYRKIPEVVSAKRYDIRLEMDLSAALRARVGSLLLGAKGKMLNTRQGLRLPDLHNERVVLEMGPLGGDEEKVLIMGLMIAAIAEHAAVQGLSDGGALRHVLIVEEAHRLLRAAAPADNPEISNVRGAAVEQFANLLAEMRAFGQGVIIVDQSPSRLLRDVVRSTHLKLVHQLSAEDDRRAVGECMALDAAQIRDLARLRRDRGELVVYQPEWPQAYCISAPLFEASEVSLSDEMRRRITEERFPSVSVSAAAWTSDPLYAYQAVIGVGLDHPSIVKAARARASAGRTSVLERVRRSAQDEDADEFTMSCRALFEEVLCDLLRTTSLSLEKAGELKEAFDAALKSRSEAGQFVTMLDQSLPGENPLETFLRAVVGRYAAQERLGELPTAIAAELPPGDATCRALRERAAEHVARLIEAQEIEQTHRLLVERLFIEHVGIQKTHAAARCSGLSGAVRPTIRQ